MRYRKANAFWQRTRARSSWMKTMAYIPILSHSTLWLAQYAQVLAFLMRQSRQRLELCQASLSSKSLFWTISIAFRRLLSPIHLPLSLYRGDLSKTINLNGTNSFSDGSTWTTFSMLSDSISYRQFSSPMSTCWMTLSSSKSVPATESKMLAATHQANLFKSAAAYLQQLASSASGVPSMKQNKAGSATQVSSLRLVTFPTTCKASWGRLRPKPSEKSYSSAQATNKVRDWYVCATEADFCHSYTFFRQQLDR